MATPPVTQGPAPLSGVSVAESKRRRDGPLVNERLREIGPIVVVVGLAFAVLGGLAVLPARTWSSQRQDIAGAQAELDRIEAEVAELKVQLEQLRTDDEIEHLARQHFDLVFPGEESYRIVPPEN